MKVQLIVVQGKPEGKTIPLLGPRFKIGRGETCNLRPGSELVSREHAEFSVTEDTVSVQDLGSRNGTLVNGKALTGAAVLKNGDLVTVGNLTFAVSIQGVPEPVAKPAAVAPPAVKATAAAASVLDEASNDDIDSWLVPESNKERDPSVYGGDTITISAFKEAANAGKAATPSSDDNDEEYERVSDDENSDVEASADDDDDEDSEEEMPEEFIDESNPFYVKKKTGGEPEKPSKQVYTDTSDAAKDILSKLLERRRNANNPSNSK